MNRLYPYKIQAHFQMWKDLLKQQDIRPEKSLDFTFGILDGAELIATASTFKNIIKCVAIDDNLKGGAIFNELLSEVINVIYNSNYSSIYVYTKPESVSSFEAIGFKEIERVEENLVFMERSTKGFEAYLDNLRKFKTHGNKIGSVVLNANPFTNGHLSLIETAHNECDILHLFVVSEDMSVFPANIRKKLVIEGTKHLDNVFVHDTNSYIVSSATFPSYFLKEDVDVTKVQAILDSKIFKYHIAKALDITDRFVGEEPFSPATQSYNQAMEEVFKGEPLPNSPTLHIIKRAESNNYPISASEVRRNLSEGNIEKIRPLVPKSTLDFLESMEAKPIIEALKMDSFKGLKNSDR